MKRRMKGQDYDKEIIEIDSDSDLELYERM